MADTSDSAATGGFLVILGIVLALVVGVILFKAGILGSPSHEIKIEIPKISQ